MTDEEFQEKTLLYFEGVLDAQGVEELNKELANSPERVREFNDMRLITAGLAEQNSNQNFSQHPAPRKFVSSVFWLAAAACLAVVLTIWFKTGDADELIVEVPANSQLRTLLLAPGWQAQTFGARYKIVEPGRISLKHGELHVKSIPINDSSITRKPLIIETDSGSATAKGTEFHIGINKNKEEDSMNIMNPKLRVLILSGIVSLSNTFGTVAGEKGDLLVAEKDAAPVKETVKANSQFAINLYKKLSEKNKGENLFFSPYSISSALAMTAEGARGKTVEEMAEVLGFPKNAWRAGEEDQQIPLKASLMSTGFEKITSMLNKSSNDPETKKIRLKLVELEKQFAEAKKVTAKADDEGDWKARRKAVEQEEKIAVQINALRKKIDKFELNVANAIWTEQTMPVEKSFTEKVGKHFGVDVLRQADFINQSELERGRINSWVEEKTKEKIKNMLPPNFLSSTTKMILANAIYFKGEWSTPFEEYLTKKRNFTLADGSSLKTDLMSGYFSEVSYAAFKGDGSFYKSPDEIAFDADSSEFYPDENGFSLVRLPYKGNKLSMVLIAPQSNDGLSNIEEKLNSENLNTWISKLKRRDTRVIMPKFKMETQYNLGEGGSTPTGTLPEMGMKSAFTVGGPHAADFSGIYRPQDPERGLFVSKVIHKTFLEVNEKGTEAAAVTIAKSEFSNALLETVPFIPVFKADKPFMLLIRHDDSGTILFMGKVNNPN